MRRLRALQRAQATDAFHRRRFALPVPSYENLMPMVLGLATKERRVRDAVAAISNELHLTTDEREETIPSGSTTLISSRVQWAITYLVQAGLLIRPKRGHFVITEHGQSVLATDLQNLNLSYTRPPELT